MARRAVRATRPAARGRRSRERADSLAIYLRAIHDYPLIDAEKELELARRIHAGDDAARDALVCANLRFVVAVAKRYQHRGLPLGDLINEGNVGLLRAARRFDETKGVRFISYAVWWVRQAILKFLADQARPVRIPIARAAELRHRNESEGDSTPFGSALSLDSPLGATNDTLFGELLADEGTPSPDEQMLEDGLHDVASAALALLGSRELAVMHRYFGFSGAEPATLADIGKALGVTRERARQIKDRAIRKIRESAYGSALATFHEN